MGNSNTPASSDELSKQNPSLNLKLPTIDSKKVLSGLNAITSGLKAGGVASGALANIVERIRDADNIALHVDPMGTDTVTSTVNLANKGFKDIQSTLTDSSNAVNSAKQNQKKINSASMHIPNIERELDRIYDEAVQEVGGGVDFDLLLPEQRKEVSKTYYSKLDKFLTGKVGDWSRFDPNSREAKAIKRKETEITNLNSYAGRDQKNMMNMDKLSLELDKVHEMNNLSKIKRDKLGNRISDLKVIDSFMNDPQAPLEVRKLNELAFEIDPRFKEKMEDSGMFSDSMSRSIINKAWDKYRSSTDDAERGALLNIIEDLTYGREDLRGERDWVENSIRFQEAGKTLRNRVKGNLESFMTQNYGSGMGSAIDANDPNSDWFLIPAKSNYISKVQDVYLPGKQKELVNKGILNSNGKLSKKWDDMTDEEQNLYNEYRLAEHEVDVALIRSKMRDIQNLNEAARGQALTKQLKAIGVDTSVNNIGYEIAKIETKLFSQLYQREKDGFLYDMDKMLADNLAELRQDAAKHRNTDMFVNQARQKRFQEICDKHIAPLLQQQYGLYNVHVNGERKQLTPTEIGNLILNDLGINIKQIQKDTGGISADTPYIAMNTQDTANELRTLNSRLQHNPAYANSGIYGRNGAYFVDALPIDPTGSYSKLNKYLNLNKPLSAVTKADMNAIHELIEAQRKVAKKGKNGLPQLDPKYIVLARNLKRMQMGQLLMYTSIYSEDDDLKKKARAGLSALSRMKSWDDALTDSDRGTVRNALNAIQKSPESGKIYRGMMDSMGISNEDDIKYVSPTVSSSPNTPFDDARKEELGNEMIDSLVKLKIF